MSFWPTVFVREGKLDGGAQPAWPRSTGESVEGRKRWRRVFVGLEEHREERMRRVREGCLRRNPPASTMKLPDPIRIEISAIDVNARAVKRLDGQVAILVLVLRARTNLDAEVLLVLVWDFVAVGQHSAHPASEAVGVARSRARVLALGFAVG